MPETIEPQPRHAIFGPSTLKNREICPGWRPDRSSDTTAADEGTMMHLAAETGDLSTLNEEQKQCVQTCLDFIDKLGKGASADFKEVRLTILNGLTFGTADRVYLFKRTDRSHAILVDHKFGSSAIDDASENRQGYAYVLGIFERFPEVESVEVYFLIPRRDEVLRHMFTRSDMPRLSLVIRTIIARCQGFDRTHDESMLNPTEYGCLYCGRKGECAAVHKYALTTAKKYAPLEIADEPHSSQIATPLDMSKAFTLARILERWCESVKKHATEMVLNGTEIPGFEMRERAGSREINNPILALSVLNKHLTQEEIVASAKISLSKLEKYVSDKAARGQKSKAIAEFNRELLEAECVSSGEPVRYLQRIRE